MATEGENRRFWLVHLMRTGGSTFTWQCRANFGNRGTYPDTTDLPADLAEAIVAVTSVAHITGLDRDRLDEIRCITGHFPYFAVDLMPHDYVTMTRLRHPVERVWSFLKMWQGIEGGRLEGAPLEEIYEDDECRARYGNHMCTMLALTEADGVDDYVVDLAIDDDRLALAKRRLHEIDVVGFQEDEPAFLEQLERRYGWTLIDPPRQRVTPEMAVPDSFRRRILADNQADLELYEYARDVVGD